MWSRRDTEAIAKETGKFDKRLRYPGEDFRRLLETTRSTRGFDGPCWAPWVWFDIDRADDLDVALRDARRLAAARGASTPAFRLPGTKSGSDPEGLTLAHTIHAGSDPEGLTLGPHIHAGSDPEGLTLGSRIQGSDPLGQTRS